MTELLGQHYLDDTIKSFRAYKKLAEKALDQTSEKEFFVTLDVESNSIAVIMKHLAGNMLSRWTDFLTTDGEKPQRNRDMEFVIEPPTSKSEVMNCWEEGWQRTFETLEALQPEDLLRKVMVRGEEHTVVQAINRQLAHYPYHVGQIVFLAKHFRSIEWKSLSIPKNKSAEFNEYLKEKGGRAEHRFDAAAHSSKSIRHQSAKPNRRDARTAKLERANTILKNPSLTRLLQDWNEQQEPRRSTDYVSRHHHFPSCKCNRATRARAGG